MSHKNKLITGSNFRDFDWNKAKLFYHIVKCGSYVKAARLAGTDQPALTRQMQGLEKQVGCPLLIRKPGSGVSLTRKGEELLNLVKPFFEDIKGFCGHNYIEIAGEKKRKIRIATSSALAACLVGDLVLEYTQNNPDLALELIVHDSFIDMALNDIDIIIQPLNPKVGEAQAESDYLFTWERKLYASPGYIKTHGEPQTVKDLGKHFMVALGQPETELPHKDTNWALGLGMPEGKFHIPIYVSNSIPNLIEAAERGIGIIGSYGGYKNPKLKNILPKIKIESLKIYFMCPSYLKEDEVIQDIKNYFQKAATT